MARRQINQAKIRKEIVTSGSEFNAVMEEMIEAAALDADKVGRAGMIQLYAELTTGGTDIDAAGIAGPGIVQHRGVPKDTNRAAIGFNISERPSEWTPPPGDYRGQLGAAYEKNKQALDAIPFGRSLSVSNNVDYLPALEDGHSKQAPRGFIALALRNMAVFFGKAVSKDRSTRYE